MSIFYQNRREQLCLYTSHNNTYATHLHRQAELLITLEGQVSVTINHQTHTLIPGQGVLVFPNQLHSLETEGKSKILLCIFDADLCPPFRKTFQNSEPVSNAFTLSDCSSHANVALDGFLQLITQKTEASAEQPTDTLYAEAYLSLLLTDLFQRMTFTAKTRSQDLELEQHVLIYLENHYTENLSLELLSKEFGVSRFALSRLFTEKLHTSFPYYVNSKRLEYACSLLTTTELSVTQIALDSGFGSPRTFFREFNNAYGITPREYRNRHA